MKSKICGWGYLNKLKQLAVAVLVLLIGSNAIAAPSDQLEPFASWTARRPKWQDDPTELAYALSRCGALYAIVGGIFRTNPSRSEDVTKGDETRTKGLLMAYLGGELAKQNGMSQEGHLERYSRLLNLYGTDLRDNRTLHNNMFHGYVEGDFLFCVDLQKSLP